MYAIVRQIAVLEQLCVSPWSVRKMPLMNNCSVVVDEIDSSRTGQMCEERIAWRHFVWVDSSEAEATASKCALLHSARNKKVLGNVGFESGSV